MSLAEQNASGDLWQVRRSQAQDIPQLLAILREAREAASWSETSLQESLKDLGQHFSVACKREEVLGLIVARHVANEGEILNLAVRPEWRRRGIGKALVTEMLSSFRGKSIETVFLEVRESNAAALAFYEQLGFSKVGRRAGYYRDPQEAALVLQRDIR